MRAWPTLLAFVLTLAASGVRADVISEQPETVAVTIYGEGHIDPEYLYDLHDAEFGVSLIAETRTVDVPAGPARIVFRGVAEGIVPQSAAVEGLPGPLIERNQDYDLLSPGALIRKWVGKPVTLVRTNPETGVETRKQAILRSGPNGVMLEIDGTLEPFKCGGPPERLVFDLPPEGMVDKATLSILTDLPEPARVTLRLSYLATGLIWAADYVARLHPDGRTLDLTGWVTLTNGSGSSFPDALTQVVAGRLAVEDDTEPVLIQADRFAARCWPMDTTTKGKRPVIDYGDGDYLRPVPDYISQYRHGGTTTEALIVTAQKRVDLAELGDYKLYTIAEPTTVAAYQTKQVLMLEQPSVGFEPVYRFVMDAYLLDDMDDGEEGEALSPVSVLRLNNKTANGLGIPLPTGLVVVLGPDGQGGTVIVGEDRVPGTPVGQDLEIELGNAMNVLVWPRLFSEREIAVGGLEMERREYEVVVVNGRDEPVVLEYLHFPDEDGFRFVSSSRRHGSRDGGPEWTFKLKPGERQVLRYTVDEVW